MSLWLLNFDSRMILAYIYVCVRFKFFEMESMNIYIYIEIKMIDKSLETLDEE